MLDGLARADVVAEAVPFDRGVEVGSPAMAVTSSVVVEEEDDVAVAFCVPGTTVAATLPDRIGMLVDIRLLGWRAVETTEESCADKHCAKRSRGMEKEEMEGIIEAKLEMCNERQAWYSPSTQAMPKTMIES